MYNFCSTSSLYKSGSVSLSFIGGPTSLALLFSPQFSSAVAAIMNKVYYVYILPNRSDVLPVNMRCTPRAAMSQYKPSCRGVNIDFNILWKSEIVQVRTVHYILISNTFSRFSLLFACFLANWQFCKRFQTK